MTKRRKKIDNPHQHQLSLFDEIQRLQQNLASCRPAPSEGSLNVTVKLRREMTHAIRTSGKDRFRIAGEMSHLVGRQITKAMLDSWTAESKPGNRPPADILPAFCRATASTEPIEVLNEPAGIFGLPGPDALRAEIQKYAEQEKRARSEKRKREMFLTEMERRGGAKKRTP
jgi:hypothetical protein